MFSRALEQSGAMPKLCERLKVSNTLTRLAVGCPTLAVSPQNGTSSDLKRSDIKNFLGEHLPHVPHPPSVRASRALCDQSHAHWNPPFQNPRSATAN